MEGKQMGDDEGGDEMSRFRIHLWLVLHDFSNSYKCMNTNICAYTTMTPGK